MREAARESCEPRQLGKLVQRTQAPRKVLQARHDVQRRDPGIRAGVQRLPRQDRTSARQEEESSNDRRPQAAVERKQGVLLQQTPGLHKPSL